MVDLEGLGRGGVQQEGAFVAGGARLQNLDAVQVLAPTFKAEAKAYGGGHAQSNFGSSCVGGVV